MKHFCTVISVALVLISCGKKGDNNPILPVQPPAAFAMLQQTINEKQVASSNIAIARLPLIKISFNAKINRATAASAVSFSTVSGTSIGVNTTYANGDSVLIVQPVAPLAGLSIFSFGINASLKNIAGTVLQSASSFYFTTQIDSSRKFPTLTDEELLNKVQRQTFKYFWDFGHPISGLARERNTSGEAVTSGGSGFGIMAILVAIHRGFISRAEGLARIQAMVLFLKNTAQTFHGAFPHWLNGTTGNTIPFSTKDNGADLVETSYLIQGLLCARQFFDAAATDEMNLRTNINTIANRVEWDWFRNGGQNVLYWHWSPSYNWDMNLPIRGWNECLITYVLAASSTTHSIPASVYTNGWKASASFSNGNTSYGYTLPLGPVLGGPLFFSQYSFLGINPNNLSDASADYIVQTRNHTLINYNYCKVNPKNYYGYSDSVWGLTASDISGGYTASSPTNDVGVIAPTAALSSFPYTPVQSMAALKFYYYVLGDKIWKEYGFTDAFSLQSNWFADSFLAIDQGPIIVMIENYRSGLLWNLFTSCPEIKKGMKNLGFSAPYL